MKFTFQLFTLVLLILPLCNVNAKNAIDTLSLSQTLQWRALLHINAQKENHEIESYVDDNSFFRRVQSVKCL